LQVITFLGEALSDTRASALHSGFLSARFLLVLDAPGAKVRAFLAPANQSI